MDSENRYMAYTSPDLSQLNKQQRSWKIVWKRTIVQKRRLLNFMVTVLHLNLNLMIGDQFYHHLSIRLMFVCVCVCVCTRSDGNPPKFDPSALSPSPSYTPLSE